MLTKADDRHHPDTPFRRSQRNSRDNDLYHIPQGSRESASLPFHSSILIRKSSHLYPQRNQVRNPRPHPINKPPHERGAQDPQDTDEAEEPDLEGVVVVGVGEKEGGDVPKVAEDT